MAKADLPPFAPLIIWERGSLVGAMIGRRHALGMTGEELDDRAGFSERYTAKMETPTRPQGRIGFHFDFPAEVTPAGNVRCSGMADVWMHSLGLRLVLLDEATAERIGATPAPMARPENLGGNVAPSHAEKRAQKGRRSTMPVQAYEASDRTKTVALTMRATITDHPWLVDRPALRAEAEDIERRLLAMAEKIAEAA